VAAWLLPGFQLNVYGSQWIAARNCTRFERHHGSKAREEKYRTLVSSVQEGVFISTPQGRFLDFNDALLRMTGYENRDDLLAVDIPTAFYANGADRERLKKLLQQHGTVADFELK